MAGVRQRIESLSNTAAYTGIFSSVALTLIVAERAGRNVPTSLWERLLRKSCLAGKADDKWRDIEDAVCEALGYPKEDKK